MSGSRARRARRRRRRDLALKRRTQLLIAAAERMGRARSLAELQRVYQRTLDEFFPERPGKLSASERRRLARLRRRHERRAQAAYAAWAVRVGCAPAAWLPRGSCVGRDGYYLRRVRS